MFENWNPIDVADAIVRVMKLAPADARIIVVGLFAAIIWRIAVVPTIRAWRKGG